MHRREASEMDEKKKSPEGFFAVHVTVVSSEHPGHFVSPLFFLSFCTQPSLATLLSHLHSPVSSILLPAVKTDFIPFFRITRTRARPLTSLELHCPLISLRLLIYSSCRRFGKAILQHYSL